MGHLVEDLQQSVDTMCLLEPQLRVGNWHTPEQVDIVSLDLER
jgi:hypothetical protein